MSLLVGSVQERVPVPVRAQGLELARVPEQVQGMELVLVLVLVLVLG
jgi:hypothetical protein